MMAMTVTVRLSPLLWQAASLGSHSTDKAEK